MSLEQRVEIWLRILDVANVGGVVDEHIARNLGNVPPESPAEPPPETRRPIRGGNGGANGAGN